MNTKCSLLIGTTDLMLLGTCVWYISETCCMVVQSDSRADMISTHLLRTLFRGVGGRLLLVCGFLSYLTF